MDDLGGKLTWWTPDPAQMIFAGAKIILHLGHKISVASALQLDAKSSHPSFGREAFHGGETGPDPNGFAM